MERMTYCEQCLWETEDEEKEYVRYLSKDIAFLKELREESRDDWEMEEILSCLIHDETQLMDDCKRRWQNARKGKEELERVRRARSSDQQSRNGDVPKREAGINIKPEVENPWIRPGD